MKMKLFKMVAMAFSCTAITVSASPLVYEGGEGIGKGKHIVFVANDHEYRSEETCPALAKILAKHQGFKCTVLFGIDEDGNIKPGAKNVPHLEVLKEADLLVFFTRFMSLSDDQVQHIVDYTEKGGPIVGLRTSTHCFNKQGGSFKKFNFNYKGEDYEGGFGKQIFGNTWDKKNGQSHYGKNHGEGGTFTAVASAKENPIMIGVSPFHAYSGAYRSQPPADSTPLIEVQVLNTFEPSSNINTEKAKVNAGWTRDYYIAPSGEKKDTRVVYTSIGASEDLKDQNTRRFLMNSCLWAIGMEKSITPELNVDIVGGFEPSAYLTSSLYRQNVKPENLKSLDSYVMPKNAKYAGFEGKLNKRLGKVLKVRPELVEKIKELHSDVDISEIIKK